MSGGRADQPPVAVAERHGTADEGGVAWSCGAGAVEGSPAIGSTLTPARHRAAEPVVGEPLPTVPIVADLPTYGRHAAQQPSVPEPRSAADDLGAGGTADDVDGRVPTGPGPAPTGGRSGRRRRGWLPPLRGAGRARNRRPAEPDTEPHVEPDTESYTEEHPGTPVVDVVAPPVVLTATIASPTPDPEAARAKLWVRLREQLAARHPGAVVDEDDERGLVLTGPSESSDSYGHAWFWFRGTVQVTPAPAGSDRDADPVAQPAPWPLRAAPRRHGNGWACHLTSSAHASRVRRGLRARLQEGARTGDCTQDAGDDLMLAFEELTSNAFRHGAGAVDVTIADTADGWLLLVEDGAPDRPPLPAAGRDRLLGGMGLGMVAGLALEVGWQPHPGRKSVWAELPSHR